MLKEEKVFKDPVHKYIYVQDQTIWDLINTKEFQRLRRIQQLGTSFFTFHGAEHSRFSHSLGVYEITRRIISQFERSDYPGWPRKERLLCLCASLLHDVGHGPFSHSMEKVFGTDHEEWTVNIVLGDTEVNKVLSMVSNDFPAKVAQVIQKRYDKSIVVSLISSQMDADRMDYLLRDAYFTGVNYGTFDLERILRVMRPYDGRIVIKESGMHAVEDYLMSRYQMYWQVYFHPVTRSAEILLRKMFLRAQMLYDSGYAFQTLLYPMDRLLGRRLELKDYLFLDESIMQSVMKYWSFEKDAILADLAQRFIDRRLLKYTSLETVDLRWLEETKLKFSQAGWDPDYYLEVNSPSDLPYELYWFGGHAKNEPIYLLNAQEELKEISIQSPIIQSISQILRGEHLLFHPDLTP